MSFSEKKISLIEWVSQLGDEKLINQLDSFRKEVSVSAYNPEKKMTLNDLLQKVSRAEDDKAAGKFHKLKEMKKKFEK